MIKEFCEKKLDRVIDYFFVFYMIILFCFDSNEYGVNLVQLTMYAMIILLFIKIFKEKRIVYNSSVIVLTVFIVFCIASSFFAFDSNLALSRSLNILMKLFFIFMLYNNYHDGKKQKFLINTFIASAVILVLYLIKSYGVLKFFGDIFTGKRIYAGVSNIDMLLGFPNINTISLISSFAVIFCLHFFFKKERIYIIPAIILLIGIIGGGSKTCLLLIIVIIFYLLKKNNVFSNINNKKRFYWIILICSVIAITTIMFLPVGVRLRNSISTIFGNGNDVSTSERIMMYEEGFNTFLSRPIVGIGLQNSNIIVESLIGKPTYFHNDLIELLACTGMIGFMLYVYSHYLIWKERRKDSSFEITMLILLCFIFLFPLACSYAMKYRYILILIAYTGVKHKYVAIPDKLLKIIKKTFDWRTYVFFLKKVGLLNCLSDEKCIKILYHAKMNKKLDLNNIKTYNEKIQWLKLYDHNEIYIKMVDKYEAKKLVESIIGKEYIIPTIGIYNSYNEIDYNKLPNQFVIKTTHDSGGVAVVSDKSSLTIDDYNKIRNKINKSLKNNYYYYWREWPYKNVKPRIIVEKYIEDKKDHELRDYKFFCFNGKMKLMFVASNRQGEGDTYFDFFDRNYKHLDIINGHPNAPVVPHKPRNYDLMIKLAEKLSKGYPHIRVDFYEKDGKVFFGELTLYHWSGLVPFEPEKWDYEIGKMLDISQLKNN